MKDPKVLNAAYNDSRGVTAAFNRNILAHLNQQFRCDFVPEAYEHLAFYEPSKRRIEMHLVPSSTQRVCFAGEVLTFEPSRPIHTESSYKFTIDSLNKLARAAGFSVEHVETDEQAWFAEVLMRA